MTAPSGEDGGGIHLRGCATVYKGVPTVCKDVQGYARVCYSVQEYIRGCNSMHGLCEGMQQCTKMNVSKTV